MKRTYYFLLLLCTLSAGCKHADSVKPYQVKFSPIGMSDVFRDTLFVATTYKFFPPRKVTILTSVTDSITFYKVVSFVKGNQSDEDPNPKRFSGYGCFEISLFKGNQLITSYKLNRSESSQYFRRLIDRLNKDKQDSNLIKIIKEDLLQPIVYQ